jgi:hypothetical protein
MQKTVGIKRSASNSISKYTGNKSKNALNTQQMIGKYALIHRKIENNNKKHKQHVKEAEKLSKSLPNGQETQPYNLNIFENQPKISESELKEEKTEEYVLPPMRQESPNQLKIGGNKTKKRKKTKKRR